MGGSLVSGCGCRTSCKLGAVILPACIVCVMNMYGCIVLCMFGCIIIYELGE